MIRRTAVHLNNPKLVVHTHPKVDVAVVGHDSNDLVMLSKRRD